MISLSTFLHRYIPVLSIPLLVLAFLGYNHLLEIDERLFDITWHLAILALLYPRTDIHSIGVSIILSWRIVDELLFDPGLISWFDFLELLIISAIILYKLYIIRYTIREVKGRE